MHLAITNITFCELDTFIVDVVFEPFMPTDTFICQFLRLSIRFFSYRKTLLKSVKDLDGLGQKMAQFLNFAERGKGTKLTHDIFNIKYNYGCRVLHTVSYHLMQLWFA